MTLMCPYRMYSLRGMSTLHSLLVSDELSIMHVSLLTLDDDDEAPISSLSALSLSLSLPGEASTTAYLETSAMV